MAAQAFASTTSLRAATGGVEILIVKARPPDCAYAGQNAPAAPHITCRIRPLPLRQPETSKNAHSKNPARPAPCGQADGAGCAA
jgi:hypothetical protein